MIYLRDMLTFSAGRMLRLSPCFEGLIIKRTRHLFICFMSFHLFSAVHFFRIFAIKLSCRLVLSRICIFLYVRREILVFRKLSQSRL